MFNTIFFFLILFLLIYIFFLYVFCTLTLAFNSARSLSTCNFILQTSNANARLLLQSANELIYLSLLYHIYLLRFNKLGIGGSFQTNK